MEIELKAYCQLANVHNHIVYETKCPAWYNTSWYFTFVVVSNITFNPISLIHLYFFFLHFFDCIGSDYRYAWCHWRIQSDPMAKRHNISDNNNNYDHYYHHHHDNHINNRDFKWVAFQFHSSITFVNAISRKMDHNQFHNILIFFLLNWRFFPSILCLFSSPPYVCCV